MGRRFFLQGLECRWVIVVFVLTYFVANIIGVYSLSRPCLEVKKRMKYNKMHAVKTFQSEDGDTIDCIDIYKQPAFDHPALRNHKVQMNPNYVQTTEKEAMSEKSTRKEERSMILTFQIWRRNGSCPTGTIPIRRTSKNVLHDCNSSENYGRKVPSYLHFLMEPNDNGGSHFLQKNLSAALLVAAATRFVGSKSRLNVWNPRVASPDDYTTSQIWLLSGGLYDYGSVESGWMVNPKLYGDTQTRFFIHWTNDGSQNTGCFDLLCSGFVQTSQEIALGAAITPVSSEAGAQYEIIVQISMDAKTANWWLRINDKIDVGYWPSSLLNDYLRTGASLAQWGGEVYSPNVGRVPHTGTALGSGNWALLGAHWSSYIAGISTMDFSYAWKYPQYVGTLSDEPNCYSVYHYIPTLFFEEPTLFFGGPGSFRNPRCP